MPQIWLVTGVSGSGRIEKLNELQIYAESKGKKVRVIDVGRVIEQKALENNISFVDERILNLDQSTLSLLRALAIQTVMYDISKDQNSDIIFIGMHALFFWRGNLIPGVSYSDLATINHLDGIITIVDDVITVCKTNAINPKWSDDPPAPESFQRWMMEEELLSDVFSSIKSVPMYVMARNQKTDNLYSFFFENKKKIYLSYPITAVRRDNPELLDKILNEYKPNLEQMFFVFNPLDIMDKTHVAEGNKEVPRFLEKESVELIDARTISRDYRFIAQSDAVVVIYLTDKQSPGVSAEMQYAYAHQIPVYLFFQGSVSPFLSQIANIYQNDEDFFAALEEFANS